MTKKLLWAYEIGREVGCNAPRLSSGDERSAVASVVGPFILPGCLILLPIKVVQERLGHKRIEITLNIYAHALPSMQQDAAAKLAAMLHT